MSDHLDRLYGLNWLSPPQVQEPQLSADMAAQLGLWTNVEFKFDSEVVGEALKEEGVETVEDLSATGSGEDGSPGALFATASEGSENSTLSHIQHQSTDSEHQTHLQNNVTEDNFNFWTDSHFGFDTFASLSSFHGVTHPTPVDTTPAPTTGKPDQSISYKEGSNVVDEEDKRRRNTLASARFRAKKKEREKALEASSKELESRCSQLEREVEGLRKENSWLKSLVVGTTAPGKRNPVDSLVDHPLKRVKF